MTSGKKHIIKQQKLITNLVTSLFKDYYLTGGTALAFYYNHRFSEDLDFFTQEYSALIPDRIMSFISQKTGFSYKLDREQNIAGLVKMKVYFLKLNKGRQLKVDIVQDYVDNINAVKNGLHSLDDIYYRKILAGIGTSTKESDAGKPIPAGRQSVKDIFDIYYLSKKYKKLSKFFLEHFTYEKAEALFVWYRSFSRMNLKLELMDLVPGFDVSALLDHVDDEILKKLPKKLM
ncbi:MAG: nucleotidyl transferase AbiEii/AbiGii toxin family protein [Candidatus Omnitrophica bacterium]|nr:nucleotidyl transferase AbiEii/AbiGii toxin family protein [Candidatus Omnitrophota bacterium]